jgi:hypothetical protein
MVAKLKLAHGTILGFKADLTETSWIQLEMKRKQIHFPEHIFKLKINLEKSR